MDAVSVDDILVEPVTENQQEPERKPAKITPADVLSFLTGSSQPPLTGFHKTIEISFSCEVSYPRISTCFLTATYPLNYRGVSNAQYVLHASGRGSSAKACKAFTSWVLDSPGYGSV